MQIHGKEYIEVKDRVLEFHKKFPNGAIITNIERNEGNFVLIKATIIPNHIEPNRIFTGYAQEDKSDGHVNATSHIENCETSAVGRALGFLGIGIETSIASGNEVKRAIERQDNIKNATTTKIPRKKVADMTIDEIRGFKMLVGQYKDLTLEFIASQQTQAGVDKGIEYLEYMADQKPTTPVGEICLAAIKRFLEEVIYKNDH